MIIGWRPRWDIDCALEHVVEWYRSYCSRPATGMRQTSLEQIAAYESTVDGPDLVQSGAPVAGIEPE